MESFKADRLANIANDKDRIMQDIAVAYVKYGGLVSERVADIERARANDGRYHRVFCIIKGMLSGGLNLAINIPAARVLTDHVLVNPDTSGDTMIELLKDCGLFEGRSPGVAVNRIADQLGCILGMTDFDMTYDNLASLKGVGPKIASWIMSLYYGNVNYFTLDVHMFRGLFGTGNATTDAIHRGVERTLLAWCREAYDGVPPLVLQWAVWCHYRGDVWDNHTGIVRSDYGV